MLQGSSSRKRSFEDDDNSSKPPPEKRIRFPKGKKVKQGDSILDSLDEVAPSKDPRLAARERAVRRRDIPKDFFEGENNDTAEIEYEDNEAFVEEGVQVEPFNLNKEREDGYFDESGNYVEYVNEKEIKDAWLDSIDSQQKYTGKSSIPINSDDKSHDLTTEDLARINRQIADILEPGETVLRALKRLKGSTDKKQKMPAETKRQFDQLTEDAMKLMDNGDYGVYDEKQEHFAREAGGYERLAQARNSGLSEGTSNTNADDVFDMFGDDDDSTVGNHLLNGGESSSVQPSNVGGLQSDYVYDESSGYYYSGSLGYYYDPASGLYGCASSGKWYSYNEDSGEYNEVQQGNNGDAVTTEG